MRGRGEEQVRAELDERNARHAGMAPVAEPDAPPPGVPARVAYAAEVAPLPAPAGPVHGAPAALVVEPAPGIDPEVLAALVSAAAARAGDLVASPDDPLSEREELVRLAAALAGTPLQARLAGTSGELYRAAAAWSAWGRAGLDVLDRVWTPPPAELARARAAVELAWGDDAPPPLTTWRNRWTVTTRRGRRQLRYGRDRRWYPFTEVAGQWWPQGDPDADPAAVLLALLAQQPDPRTGP